MIALLLGLALQGGPLQRAEVLLRGPLDDPQLTRANRSADYWLPIVHLMKPLARLMNGYCATLPGRPARPFMLSSL
jgi:hypothetical protein